MAKAAYLLVKKAAKTPKLDDMMVDGVHFAGTIKGTFDVIVGVHAANKQTLDALVSKLEKLDGVKSIERCDIDVTKWYATGERGTQDFVDPKKKKKPTIEAVMGPP